MLEKRGIYKEREVLLATFQLTTPIPVWIQLSIFHLFCPTMPHPNTSTPSTTTEIQWYISVPCAYLRTVLWCLGGGACSGVLQEEMIATPVLWSQAESGNPQLLCRGSGPAWPGSLQMLLANRAGLLETRLWNWGIRILSSTCLPMALLWKLS